MTGDNQLPNLARFRECFSSAILHRLSLGTAKKQKRRSGKRQKNVVNYVGEPTPRGHGDGLDSDAEELAEFIEFLASEVFDILPPELKGLSYADLKSDSQIGRKYASIALPEDLEAFVPNMPPSVTESIEAYGLLSRSMDLSIFVLSVIKEYIATVTMAPPIWTNTRASACEICDRQWIPLTYHHLIPKQVHEKALKRHWHDDWRLNSVAWLCRACHSFVHRIASNEELAKDLWTVDLLMSREDVRAWAKWVGRVRWKTR